MSNILIPVAIIVVLALALGQLDMEFKPSRAYAASQRMESAMERIAVALERQSQCSCR